MLVMDYYCIPERRTVMYTGAEYGNHEAWDPNTAKQQSCTVIYMLRSLIKRARDGVEGVVSVRQLVHGIGHNQGARASITSIIAAKVLVSVVVDVYLAAYTHK